MTARRIRSSRRKRGAELVEFAFVAFQLMLVIFAALEFGRMVLVYNNVCNAARVGVRYAIVHGADASNIGKVATATDVCAVVTDYAKSGLLDTAALPCTVKSTDTGGRIYVNGAGGLVGTTVQVTVVYRYDPFMTALPLKVDLGTTTQGIITF